MKQYGQTDLRPLVGPANRTVAHPDSCHSGDSWPGSSGVAAGHRAATRSALDGFRPTPENREAARGADKPITDAMDAQLDDARKRDGDDNDSLSAALVPAR